MIERKLRFAAALILAGLLVQLITLLGNHPLAFLAFIFLGSPLIFAGVVIYLYSLVSGEGTNPNHDS